MSILHPRTIDLSGRIFGSLLALYSTKTESRKVFYMCLCACGEVVEARGNSLRTGNTKSCGCRTGKPGGRIARNPEHVLYGLWTGIKTRCRNPASTGYHNYGGRGISLCEAWLKFENFISDMGPRPTGTTLDRIDNNGNYEPNNCRWATRKEQMRNMRKTRLVTHGGVTKSISTWAEELGFTTSTLRYRIRRNISFSKGRMR